MLLLTNDTRARILFFVFLLFFAFTATSFVAICVIAYQASDTQTKSTGKVPDKRRACASEIARINTLNTARKKNDALNLHGKRKKKSEEAA